MKDRPLISKRKILRKVLNATKANKIIVGFAIYFFVCAFIIWLIEPNISTYLDSIWFCYATFATIGYGDIIVVTTLGRFIAIMLSISSIFVIALVTGVVVAFYNEFVSAHYRIEKSDKLSKLERLDELSKDELKEISDFIKKIK